MTFKSHTIISFIRLARSGGKYKNNNLWHPVKFLGPKIWAMIPQNIKKTVNLWKNLNDSLKHRNPKLALAECA